MMLIKVYILTVLVPAWLEKLWGKELIQKHTYFLSKAGTQWRALNMKAVKVFPIQERVIFTINAPKDMDGPVPIPDEILKGYLDGKDTLAAVQEKIGEYLIELEGDRVKAEIKRDVKEPAVTETLELAVQNAQLIYNEKLALLADIEKESAENPDNQTLKDRVDVAKEERRKVGQVLGTAKAALTRAQNK